MKKKSLFGVLVAVALSVLWRGLRQCGFCGTAGLDEYGGGDHHAILHAEKRAPAEE